MSPQNLFTHKIQKYNLELSRLANENYQGKVSFSFISTAKHHKTYSEKDKV